MLRDIVTSGSGVRLGRRKEGRKEERVLTDLEENGQKG